MTLASCLTAQCHSKREPDACETDLHPIMTIFYYIVARFLKKAVHFRSKRRGQRIWKLSGYRSSLACPTTTRTQSQGGRCPASTRTQSLGGLLTWGFVLPAHELNHWKDGWPELLSCHHSDSTGGRTLNLPPKELNPWEVHLSTTRVVISSNHSSLPIHWERRLTNHSSSFLMSRRQVWTCHAGISEVDPVFLPTTASTMHHQKQGTNRPFHVL